jgi:hypothetical protein
VPVTQAFVTGSQFFYFCNYQEAASATRRYTIGPELRISLRHGLGIAAGALYKRLGYDSASEFACADVHTRAIENSWEFPILATYRLPGRLPGRPYVSAGPSFRLATNASLTGYEVYPGGYATLPDPTQSPSALVNHRSHSGVAVGVGWEARLRRLRIRPQVRYTRWRADAQQLDALHSNQNQVDLLVGFGVLFHDRVP